MARAVPVANSQPPESCWSQGKSGRAKPFVYNIYYYFMMALHLMVASIHIDVVFQLGVASMRPYELVQP